MACKDRVFEPGFFYKLGHGIAVVLYTPSLIGQGRSAESRKIETGDPISSCDIIGQNSIITARAAPAVQKEKVISSSLYTVAYIASHYIYNHKNLPSFGLNQFCSVPLLSAFK